MKFGHGRVPSVQSRAQHTFASVPRASIPRSQFNRSHGYKTTFNEGLLIPIYVDEVLPGDTFNLRMTAFGRLATPIFPLMDNMYLDVFFFFVPNRLVWENWERFNGAQTNPTDTTDYLIPILDPTMAPLSTTGFVANSVADYFALPTLVAGLEVNALPFRGLNLIYNEWYRDQNLQTSLTVPTDDGPDDPSIYSIQRRGKRHDYFTSCLPWPQKINDGSTLNLPLQGTAPVISSGDGEPVFNNTTGTPDAWKMSFAAGSAVVTNAAGVASAGTFIGWNDPKLAVDLSSATGVTINELREAFQIQRMFERDARGGTRYTEIIHSHFGVTSPDARLQRPEYLGGGSSSIQITPVTQTSESGTTPQGNLAAFGTLSLNRAGFVKSFVEHGYVFGLACIRADLNYQQGLNRMWSRQTRYDFYWPALSHLGEQAVLSKEIYSDGTANDDLVFGYQERHAEYRYFPGQITGDFRSNATGTLDSWHLAQDFGSRPTLNSTFIVENAPMTRVLANGATPHFLFDSYFQLKCARPMPVYAVPGLIDHF